MGRVPLHPTNFDPERLQFGADGLPERLAIDPLFPSFVVRSTIFFARTKLDPLEALEASQRWTARELQRFQFPELTIPRDFLICHEDDAGDITAYHYVQRLRGVQPDPANPEHWPHNQRLVKAALRYLGNTAVGGSFCGEFMLLDEQFTIGRPHFGQRQQPERLYIHDFELITPYFFNNREGSDNSVRPHGYTFAEAVSFVYDFICRLPDSTAKTEFDAAARQLL